MTDDQSIIDKASKAGNGAKFHALWSGDTSGYPSSSEADQALTNILAFWTKDQSQIDRLFRQSGLYRQKWDEKHQAGGATYGQMTIEKALAGVTDTYTPGHKDKTTPQVEMPSPTEEKKPPDYLPSLFPHLTLSQGLELPPSDYLVYGAIERDDLGMIYGDAAAGKTYLSIDLAVCLATGSPWMNRWQIKEPRKVLYFISEGRKAFFRRILAAVNGMGLRGYDVKKVYQLVDENFIIVPEVPQFFQNNAERHFTHYLDLWQEMESPQVDIFFIDTIRRASVGGNENAQQDVSIVIDGINRMQQKMGSAACFIHHSNKSGGYSGSTVYRGNIDFQFRVEGVYREPRKLTIDKIRDGELDGPIPGNDHVAIFKPDEVSGGTFTTWPEVETLNLNEDTKAAAKAKTEILYILEEAKMPLNQSEIVKRSSVGRYNTLTALKELEYENKILAETRGRSNVYQITKRGEF